MVGGSRNWLVEITDRVMSAGGRAATTKRQHDGWEQDQTRKIWKGKKQQQIEVEQQRRQDEEEEEATREEKEEEEASLCRGLGAEGRLASGSLLALPSRSWWHGGSPSHIPELEFL
jgi:muramoyltetrapeptide carboxypeptidase LdcA involved in peptidoglycan recycling